MNKDLSVINEEIDLLAQSAPSMQKYERLGSLLVCKQYIENSLKTDKTTISEILDDKMEKIGARSTIVKLEPILTELINDIELIAPTISGELIKHLKEM